MSALLDKANKYIQAEEYLETHKEHRGDNGQEQDKRAREDSPRGGRGSKRSRRDERHPKEMLDMKNLTPLTAKPSRILHEIKDKQILEKPDKMRLAPSPSTKKQKIESAPTISFSDDDVGDTRTPHDDPLVVTLRVGNFDMKRILVDNGSSAEVLQDVETRYPQIDKVALALVISARKLRSYFQSHAAVVLTDQPLGKVLQNPDVLGRLVNWSVELGEFDIKYKPRTVIKAQALSGFVVECTIPEHLLQLILSEVSDPWLLYVDGSSKVGSSGAGLILIGPEKFMIEYALHFNF
ncbi:hypothetical protein RJ639_042608 [Escallonia herrerae]|uniref:Reverse transcriptase RNase H-like domain-containing protein n=1 Tax=Escallonia herrerae TaxID=1293975 RepID=A0AA89B587_9ASTE|nr:hypothetical protein RJ639_042608 [Escallonia herrerae]